MVTEQQPPQIVPPRQETRAEASVLQTPQKEDISRKRDRETPFTTSTTQGEKRHRMNHLSLMDIIGRHKSLLVGGSHLQQMII